MIMIVGLRGRGRRRVVGSRAFCEFRVCSLFQRKKNDSGFLFPSSSEYHGWMKFILTTELRQVPSTFKLLNYGDFRFLCISSMLYFSNKFFLAVNIA